MKEKERGLSPHVQSRYYRAPEVILRQKNYNYLADMWSLGAILAECSNLTTGGSKQSDMGMETSSNVIFKGDSCYPLSPRVLSYDFGDESMSFNEN